MANWLREYNREQYLGKMSTNAKIGWAGERHIAALFGMQKTKHGFNLPDLVSDERKWEEHFYAEVKCSKSKALMYIGQIFMDELTAKMQQESTLIKNPQMRFDFRREENPRVYFICIDRLNSKGTRPESREETICFEWGDIYVIPITIVRSLFIKEVLRKRHQEITGTTEQEKLAEVQKALSIIKKGILQGTKGQSIMDNLFQAHAAGNLGINPEYFGCERYGDESRGTIPHRFENIMYSTLEALFANDRKIWGGIAVMCPELDYENFSYIIMNGSNARRIWFMDKDSSLILKMAQQVQEKIPIIEQIAGLRKAFSKRLYPRQPEGGHHDSRKAIQEKLQQGNNAKAFQGLMTWQLSDKETELLEEILRATE